MQIANFRNDRVNCSYADAHCERNHDFLSLVPENRLYLVIANVLKFACLPLTRPFAFDTAIIELLLLANQISKAVKLSCLKKTVFGKCSIVVAQVRACLTVKKLAEEFIAHSIDYGVYWLIKN